MAHTCEIIIYTLDHIVTVFDVSKYVNTAVRLCTPYASVASTGVDYYIVAYQAVCQRYPEAQIPLTIDCGPYPGHAMVALRSGVKLIYVDLQEGHILQAMRSMAEQTHAQILTLQDKPKNVLDMLLLPENDSEIVKQWLLKFKDLSHSLPL